LDWAMPHSVRRYLKYKWFPCLVCDRSQMLECPSCGKVVEQLSSSVSKPPTQEESCLIRQIALKVSYGPRNIINKFLIDWCRAEQSGSEKEC
jgi:hypothetical protein